MLQRAPRHERLETCSFFLNKEEKLSKKYEMKMSERLLLIHNLFFKLFDR